MDRLGERIRKKRELMHLHLGGLAEKVGVSSSALSQIETSKSFPSIVTLKLIADALHTSVGELMGENEVLVHQPVMRKDQIVPMGNDDGSSAIFSLTHRDETNRMDAFLIRLKGHSLIDGKTMGKIGQVFCRVETGSLRVELNGTTHCLDAGDNLYFNAGEAFLASNPNDDDAELLWVQTPAGVLTKM